MPADGLASLPGHVASSDRRFLLLSVVVATFTFVIRAVRWRVLLQAEDGTAVSWSATWHATAIGFMANNVLPLRLGEVARALTVSRLSTTRFPAAVASVAVERVFDSLAVVGLFAVVLAGPGVPADMTLGGRPAGEFVRLIGMLGIAALLSAAVAGFYPAFAERVLRKLVPWPAIADKLAGPLHSFAHGLRVLHDPKRITLIILGSIALWVVNAWSFALALQAFGLPSGLGTAIVVQTCVVFFVALPSTPGFVGAFEGGFKAGALLLGLPLAATFATAATYHVLTYVPITLLGAWSLSRTGLKLGELKSSSAP